MFNLCHSQIREQMNTQDFISTHRTLFAKFQADTETVLKLYEQGELSLVKCEEELLSLGRKIGQEHASSYDAWRKTQVGESLAR
jgi:hypothetical protein